MSQNAIVRTVSFSLFIGLVCVCISAPARGDINNTASLPSCSKIRSEVGKFFSSELPKLKDADIITREELEPLLDEESFDWLGSDRAKLKKRLLPKSDYLVKELRTDKGRIFCQKIGSQPLGYDRIDRLRSGGSASHRAVTQIIESKDGYRWINQLASSSNSQGQHITQFINGSGIKFSKDFSKPTGRIYTKKMLIDALCKVREDQDKQ